ncbi:hypothetical protein CDL12_03686 [Handroanthus impetiginosus]|uniref:Knottin scorpion toxin-like domain-containing protein n=1 Tax=Handroanthus impetiginosus TaxID=429701 RepID=A0A2G9I1D8_9LAMI|nr:hypothetical protein CDL12_03686 [Handroanthus impetiginosus]
MAVNKWVVILLVIAMTIVTMGPTSVECAIGIDLNPCTQAECVAACKKVLEERYVSATCAAGPKGKYCICLG